jgi:hypothetical protein
VVCLGGGGVSLREGWSERVRGATHGGWMCQGRDDGTLYGRALLSSWRLSSVCSVLAQHMRLYLLVADMLLPLAVRMCPVL